MDRSPAWQPPSSTCHAIEGSLLVLSMSLPGVMLWATPLSLKPLDITAFNDLHSLTQKSGSKVIRQVNALPNSLRGTSRLDLSRVATYSIEEKECAKHSGKFSTCPAYPRVDLDGPCRFLQLLLLYRLLWRLLWCFRLPHQVLLVYCGRLAHPVCMLAIASEDSMPIPAYTRDHR